MTTDTQHDPTELRQRIRRLYHAAGAPTNSQGQERPISWAAEQLGVQRNTVSRWLMDPPERTPKGSAFRTLELLEDQYDVS